MYISSRTKILSSYKKIYTNSSIIVMPQHPFTQARKGKKFEKFTNPPQPVINLALAPRRRHGQPSCRVSTKAPLHYVSLCPNTR